MSTRIMENIQKWPRLPLWSKIISLITSETHELLIQNYTYWLPRLFTLRWLGTYCFLSGEGERKGPGRFKLDVLGVNRAEGREVIVLGVGLLLRRVGKSSSESK